jgi:hypothetical protein
MSDEQMLAELRAELAKQREDSDARYDALVRELDRQGERDEERDAKTLTPASARASMTRGYEQSQNGGES